MEQHSGMRRIEVEDQEYIVESHWQHVESGWTGRTGEPVPDRQSSRPVLVATRTSDGFRVMLRDAGELASLSHAELAALIQASVPQRAK